MTHDEKDSILRALNEVAISKKLFIDGAKNEDILRHLDASLSWSRHLIGVVHPMSSYTCPSLQCTLLNHEDMNHLVKNI